MLKIKNIILSSLIYFTMGAFQSGLPEIFGYLNPWVVLISLMGVGFLISRLKSAWELLYLIPFSVGFYLYMHYALVDVLDSFLVINSWPLALGLNLLLAVFIKTGVYVKFILKLWLDKKQIEVKPLHVVVVTSLIIFYSVYQTMGWASNVTFLISHWVEYLVWLPIFGSFIYGYFLSLIVALIAFKIKDKFLIGSFVLFVFSHLLYFTNVMKIKSDSTETLQVSLAQYPFYIITHQKNAPDSAAMKREIYQFIKEGRGDLVIYPEASALFVLDDAREWMRDSYISSTKMNHQASLLSAYKREGSETFNTSVLLPQAGAPQIYYKNKLFPVGETEVWGISNFNNGFFSSSLSTKENNPLWVIKGFSVLPLLCFENFHNFYWQQRIKDQGEVVDLVTLQSNEAWVKDKNFRRIFFNILRLQAKELGVSVAKADTAGPSGLIGPNGEVVSYSEEAVALIPSQVPKLEKNSVYSKFGALPFLVFVLFQILGCLKLNKQKK